MTRLAHAIALDARLQWRHGIYFVALGMTVIAAAVISALPPLAWRPLGALLIANMEFTTVFLVAALVLLEKDQGVLGYVIVTPLAARDYLLAKAASLGGVAVAENVALAMLGRAYGVFGEVDWLLLVPGLVMSAVLFTLLGICAVMRYDTLNEALIPFALVWGVLMAPLLTAIGVPESPLFYLIPTHGLWLVIQNAVGAGPGWASLYEAWLAMRGGGGSPGNWGLIYGFGYPALWIAGSLWLGRRMLRGYALRQFGG